MKYLNIALSFLLLACLFHMPYGYYTIVRITAMVAFSWLAIQKYRAKEHLLMLAFAIGAILFQPFLKFPLGRTIWNVVDIIYAIILITTCFFYRKSSN